LCIQPETLAKYVFRMLAEQRRMGDLHDHVAYGHMRIPQDFWHRIDGTGRNTRVCKQ
jgi:hypothetical protein